MYKKIEELEDYENLLSEQVIVQSNNDSLRDIHSIYDTVESIKQEDMFNKILGVKVFGNIDISKDFLFNEIKDSEVDFANGETIESFTDKYKDIELIDIPDSRFQTIEEIKKYMNLSYSLELKQDKLNHEIDVYGNSCDIGLEFDNSLDVNSKDYALSKLMNGHETEEGFKKIFNKDNYQSLASTFASNTISNMKAFNTSHIMLANKLAFIRKELSKDLLASDLSNIHGDVKKRLKGFKLFKQKWVNSIRVNTFQNALFRFKEGNTFEQYKGLNKPLSPKTHEHIVLNNNTSITSEDLVFLTHSNRVIVISNDLKDVTRPAYGIIDEKVMNSNKETIASLKIDNTYLTDVLNTTVLDIKLESDRLLLVIRNLKKEIEFLNEEDNELIKHKVRQIKANVILNKTLFTMLRGATSLANSLLKGEDDV